MSVATAVDLSNPGTARPRASVVLDTICKAYGAVSVVNDVSLEIEDGEFVVFVGPSGCGKSTLLRMIAGLEEVSRGGISIGGRVVTEAPASQRGVAMVFQSYALYPHMTVRQNLGYSLRIAGRKRGEIDARVSEGARMLRLEPLLDRRPGQLSGGQRQRVAIGRAIVREPALFLFDEPLSNLDAELRNEMRIEIAQLHRRLGNTMIYVTHDQTEAMTMADRIVVLRNGRVEQVGTPREVYERPANSFVAGFIGAPRMNLLEIEPAPGGGFSLDGVHIDLPSAGTAPARRLGLRPEHLKLGGDGAITLEVEIEAVENLGATAFLHCRTAAGQRVVAEHRAEIAPRPGERLRVSADRRHVHLFDAAGKRLDAGEDRQEPVPGPAG